MRMRGLTASLALVLSLLSSSCGSLSSGAVSANENAPTGSILASGSFTSLNGKTVSGIAKVILDTGNVYWVRLEGLSAPSESGLQVWLTKTSSTTGQSEKTNVGTLRSVTGSTNYQTTITSAIAFTAVTIRSPAANLDYGTALLK